MCHNWFAGIPDGNPMFDPNGLYTAQDLMELFAVSKSTVIAWKRDGIIVPNEGTVRPARYSGGHVCEMVPARIHLRPITLLCSFDATRITGRNNLNLMSWWRAGIFTQVALPRLGRWFNVRYVEEELRVACLLPRGISAHVPLKVAAQLIDVPARYLQAAIDAGNLRVVPGQSHSKLYQLEIRRWLVDRLYT